MLESSANRRPRILVVDDDPIYRAAVVAALKREYFVAVADNGPEGLEKALAFPPDVIVIDVIMQLWDGLKTLKAFRAKEALRSVPIVMLTTDPSRSTVIACIEAGADAYILKTGPAIHDLLAKTASLIHQRAPLRGPTFISAADKNHAPEAAASDWDYV